jgi:hypothetical protein
MSKRDLSKHAKPVNRVAARVMRKGSHHIAITELFNPDGTPKTDGKPLRWQPSRKNPKKRA